MLFKSKNKANLYRIKNFTLFKKAVVFIKILLKNAKDMSRDVATLNRRRLQFEHLIVLRINPCVLR
jgi:hypothetical protein